MTEANSRHGCTLRTACVADAGAVGACVQAAYAHYVARMGKPPGPMLADHAAAIAAHGATLAERDGRILGVVIVHQRPQGPLLDNVAVHPDAQGLGLGGVLIGHAEAIARAAGATHLDLYTHECMVENVALYKHLGYTETRRVEEAGYARIYMRKSLTNSE